jgi:hypothetical protein
VPETVPQSVAASIPRLVVTNTLASKIIDEERKQKLIRLASTGSRSQATARNYSNKKRSNSSHFPVPIAQQHYPDLRRRRVTALFFLAWAA